MWLTISYNKSDDKINTTKYIRFVEEFTIAVSVKDVLRISPVFSAKETVITDISLLHDINGIFLIIIPIDAGKTINQILTYNWKTKYNIFYTFGLASIIIYISDRDFNPTDLKGNLKDCV